MKKYEFTGQTINHLGRELKQIKRIRDGFVGGYIESERNLSHNGDCFVFGNAKVFGDAKVFKYEECVNITNQKNNITLTPNLIIIGCKTWETLEEFEQTYKQIGLENNYTEDECEMTVELVRAVMKRIGKVDPETVEVEIEHNGKKYKIDIEKAKELGVLK